jgi:hypothetical protein
LRSLLGEREPAFAAMLRAVERQIDQEMSRGARREPAHPCGRRHIVNTARLYHLDSSVCVDHWTCREAEHTSVPPRCGAPLADRAAGREHADRAAGRDQADRAAGREHADRPAGCELPKGHPGPHLHLADRIRRAAAETGNAGSAGSGNAHAAVTRQEL